MFKKIKEFFNFLFAPIKCPLCKGELYYFHYIKSNGKDGVNIRCEKHISNGYKCTYERKYI